METTTLNNQKITGTWGVDNVHSNVDFTVNHLVISQVNGSFSDYSGSIKNEGDSFESAQVEFNIKTSSISTNNEMRDNHLRSDDFFNAEEYPEITFKSNNIEKTADSSYNINGDLTIRDVSKPVTFTAKIGGIAKDGYGNTKLGLRVSTTINRFDYNLKWNQLTEAGGVTVGKEVDINANLQFAKQ